MTFVPNAALDAINQAIRMQEINPLDARALPQKLVLTNIAAAIEYHYFEVGFKPWHVFDMDFSAALGVGVTIWGSDQDDGTAPGSITLWHDISSDYGAASYNADAIAKNTTPNHLKYIRLKVDSTGGAGTEDLTVQVRTAAVS